MPQDLLSIKGLGERESAEQNWTKRDVELPNGNGFVHYEFRSPPQDIDPTLLSVLQVCLNSSSSCGYL